MQNVISLFFRGFAKKKSQTLVELLEEIQKRDSKGIKLQKIIVTPIESDPEGNIWVCGKGSNISNFFIRYKATFDKKAHLSVLTSVAKIEEEVLYASGSVTPLSTDVDAVIKGRQLLTRRVVEAITGLKKPNYVFGRFKDVPAYSVIEGKSTF